MAGSIMNDVDPVLRAPPCQNDCAEKLEEIEMRIAELQRMRATLTRLVSQCSGHGSVAGCPIIEALSNEESNHE